MARRCLLRERPRCPIRSRRPVGHSLREHEHLVQRGWHADARPLERVRRRGLHRPPRARRRSLAQVSIGRRERRRMRPHSRDGTTHAGSSLRRPCLDVDGRVVTGRRRVPGSSLRIRRPRACASVTLHVGGRSRGDVSPRRGSLRSHVRRARLPRAGRSKERERGFGERRRRMRRDRLRTRRRGERGHEGVRRRDGAPEGNRGRLPSKPMRPTIRAGARSKSPPSMPAARSSPFSVSRGAFTDATQCAASCRWRSSTNVVPPPTSP